MGRPSETKESIMAQTVVWQRVEGLFLFVGGIIFLWYAGGSLPWWSAILVFFLPDLSFAGYLFGPKAGALLYNAMHIYGFGAAVVALGFVIEMPLLVALGALWFAHSGFDRMLGYGLKSPTDFRDTHLGHIGA
jgi:hypothetical protein